MHASQGVGRLAIIIGQCGAIPSLLGLLQTSESILQKVILKCLRNIVTSGDTNSLTAVTNGGLEIILNMLLNANSGGLKRPLLEILSALSLLREVRRVIFSSGDVCFLIESARCGRMISRTRTAQAIGMMGLVKKSKADTCSFWCGESTHGIDSEWGYFS
ncbi:hypothetical protein ACH5RR_027794 [Cinchona calisaya]|uniref:Uncharacterized protein n=1 Tax=Cinchona calisaya TaxID=153742 RepID=A0ABD2YLZ1_9GENT